MQSLGAKPTRLKTEGLQKAHAWALTSLNKGLNNTRVTGALWPLLATAVMVWRHAVGTWLPAGAYEQAHRAKSARNYADYSVSLHHDRVSSRTR